MTGLLVQALEHVAKAQDLVGVEIQESDGPTLQSAAQALRLASEGINKALEERR